MIEIPTTSPAEASAPEMEIEPLPLAQRVKAAWVCREKTVDLLGRSLQPLAIGLLDELVDLTVLAPHGGSLSELPSPPLEILRYAKPGLMTLFTHQFESLAEELVSRKVQLIHALDAPAAALASRLADLTDIRWLVSCHSTADARHLATLDARCAAVLADTEPIRQSLQQARVAPVDKLHVIRPGFYQERHATCFVQPAYTASIVAGCQLDDFASYAAVLRSFAELRARHYDCLMFLIGQGKAEGPLRALAEQLGLRQELTFVDHKSGKELADILKAADIFISPAPGKTVDMGSLLAMAAGVPVLAAANPDADFLIDGQTALLFPQGNIADLTTKLTGLLNDHPAATKLAEAALEYLRANHSAARMILRTAELYRSVVCTAPALSN